MSRIKLRPNRLLVEISEVDRDAIFKQAVTTASGEKMFIIKDTAAKFGTDKFYSQSVNIGTVLNVSPELTEFLPGDHIIFDHTVDSSKKNIFEETPESKKVVIVALHTRHTDDYFIPASNGNKSAFVWRIGDVDEMSHVIAIVREGNVIPINGLILAEGDIKKNDHVNSGVYYNPDKSEMCTRKILLAPTGSEYSSGDYVMVRDEILFKIDISGRKYDCFPEEDIVLHLPK